VWVQKKSPLWPAVFWHFLTNGKILNQFFTHLLQVPIYAILQIFIQLSRTLTKLCHIKHDYLVHVICSKCPPSAETRAFLTFAKVVDSFVDRYLWQVIPDLLLLYCQQTCWIWHDVTQQWRHLLSKQSYKLSYSEMSKIRWVVSLSIWHNFVKIGDNWTKICNLA